jgi:hypothetical protein
MRESGECDKPCGNRERIIIKLMESRTSSQGAYMDNSNKSRG